MLYSSIRDELFSNPRVVSMVELTAKLVEFMKIQDVEDVRAGTKKHVRRKLKAEFGDSLKIFPACNGKLLVLPDNLQITSIAAEMMKMKEAIDSLRESKSSSEQLIGQAALHFRDELKISQAEVNHNWPPQPEELNENYLPPTPRLALFLKTLATGDAKKLLTPRLNKLILSFFQDLLFAISTGLCTTAKHILLPWAVKTLTGNVELIKLLNRLGHGVSYTKLEEVEAALCLQKIENESKAGVVLPSTIHLRIPTTLAFDNIDRPEETLSGGATSHRVNGIAIQMSETAEAPIPAEKVQPQEKLPQKKKQSIEMAPLILPSNNAGEHIAPPLTKSRPVDSSEAVKIAEMKDISWCMVRLKSNTEQNVCGWTGFNIMTRNDISVKQDTVGYLPTMNAPATAMNTVNEVLTQALKYKEALELTNIVCVFDQALYAKAAEITWKHSDKFQSIVPRMGVLHTICNYLGMIEKWFRDAGLHDLAVETEIVAEGSVDAVLNG